MNKTLTPVSSGLRWCFSSLGCPDLSLDQMAALARKFGIGQLELRAACGRIDLPALAAEAGWMGQSPAALLGGGDDVRVVAFNASAKLSMPFEEASRELVDFAPLMTFFGAGSLRVFDGEMDGPAALERAWRWLDQWEALRSREGWDFSLSIETHSSLLEPESIERLFSRGHPHVHLLWDSHHTWKKAGLDPVALWPVVRPWTRHIHVKDSISVPSKRHPYSYVLPGEGEFPLAELLAVLDRDTFDGFVSLEWEKLWHPDIPPLSDALTALGK
ncbi:sugar phosphate isomerase/epimerase [Ruficoccus amylovorans]|uniref:Sugar phosphate isomerase/epimerase n=1 Tax=Ruficoccus amylovorans TaxID=1804625 RepID=A0A842HJV5_9BACT|nr:TIM barrel protein [Ruficoccus amylovorans]MBC2595441.1 sugar phosphate isomerase/epimerase [Ruficoccus amylovorans]